MTKRLGNWVNERATCSPYIGTIYIDSMRPVVVGFLMCSALFRYPESGYAGWHGPANLSQQDVEARVRRHPIRTSFTVTDGSATWTLSFKNKLELAVKARFYKELESTFRPRGIFTVLRFTWETSIVLQS